GIFRADFIDGPMHLTSLTFPIKFHHRTLDFSFGIGHQRQRSVKDSFFLAVPPKKVIAHCGLLQDKKVAWIEFDRALEIAQRFFLVCTWSATLNVTLEFEYSRII